MRPLLIVFLVVAAPLAADPIEGMWRTEPDRKNLVSHIRIAPCANAYCGVIERALDPAGAQVQTPNVGKRLFWNLVPVGGGNYDSGTVYVPLLDVTAAASARLSGDRLRVTGCKGVVCEGQDWQRIR